jgi:Ni/Fe-hydrogenase 1 B-type cytochrome subunit
MVQEQVERKGGTVTVDQARSVAHEYSDKLWMLHKYLGYGLAILLLWRIIIEVMQSKEKKLSARLRQAASYPAGDEKKHFVLVQYSYLIFYVLFIVMALTGLILAFEDQKWLDPLHRPANEIHEITQWGMYAYMIIHIVGVIRADVTKYGGIVSRMINGQN